MINVFILRRYASLVTSGMITAILFFIGLRFFGFMISLGFMFLGVLLGVVIGGMLLKNPFTQMLEGQGILAFNLDSTGVVTPFIVAVHSPFIKGSVNGRLVNDIFDREAVYQLAIPVKADKQAINVDDKLLKNVLSIYDWSEEVDIKDKLSLIEDDKKREIEKIKLYDDYKKDRIRFISELEKKRGSIVLTLNEEQYNKGRFALFHYPLLIYNQQIDSILTKDFLADQEKTAFSEHEVLYLNKKVEELTSVVRDFSRYVVEQLKPKSDWLSSGWVKIIIIIFIIIMLALFAPSIIKLFGGGGDAVSGGIQAAKNTITPMMT